MYRGETLDQHAEISLLLMPEERRVEKHWLEMIDFNFKKHKYVEEKPHQGS